MTGKPIPASLAALVMIAGLGLIYWSLRGFGVLLGPGDAPGGASLTPMLDTVGGSAGGLGGGIGAGVGAKLRAGQPATGPGHPA